MTLKEKLFYAILALGVLCGLVYLSKSIIMPLIYSMVVAYLVNPVVTRFYKKQKVSRLRATILILGLFFALFVCVSLIVLPIIYFQSASLIESFPHYFNVFNTNFYPKIVELLSNLGINVDGSFSFVATQEGFNSNILNISTDFLNNAFNSSAFLINILSIFFIMPFLIFYILKDWDLIVTAFYSYLPRNNSKLIRGIIQEIDRTLTHYIKGQLNVCLILGTIYAILLSFTGLNFGFVIGFFTGMLSFIPYIGMIIGVILAIIIGLFQWGLDFPQLIIVALIFFTGQVIESNFLTPKLIGSKIGLHPVWMIFGLFFFGDLLGFVGVLAAVPLMAICSVILGHLSKEYKERYADYS